jgi:hypothetical protein
VLGTYDVAKAIVPSNSVNFDPFPADAIFVGGDGTVVVVFENGTSASIVASKGQVLPFKAIRVNLTGTTATLLVALYQV